MLSLRWRLVAVALGVASVGLVVANGVVYSVVKTDLNNRIDRQLEDFSGRRLFVRVVGAGPAVRVPFGGPAGRANGAPTTGTPATGTPATGTPATGTPAAPGASTPPPDAVTRRPPRSALETYAELRNAKGELVVGPQRFSASEEGPPEPLSLPKVMGKPPRDPRIFEADDLSGKPYRVIYRELRENMKGETTEGLVFAIPTVDRDETLSKLRLVQLIAVAATLAMLAIFASLLVRLGLRPLRRIETSAATIAAGDLSHRIESVGSPRTEVGRLGASLNVMLGQIEGAFAEKQRSEAQLKRFVANASHELRTPLTSIRGYADLYRRGVVRQGPALENSMNRIASEANRMGALVEDLLAVARLDEILARPMEPVDLASVVRDATDDYRVVDPTRPVELILTGEPWVEGDPFAIMQVLTNLLGNVRVHTPPGTAIEISLSGTPTEAILAITDHGPGIAADDIPFLFEPFYRTDPARSRNSGGAGLGLTIVAGIVANQRGELRVTSDVGVHTTFTLRLPRMADLSIGEGSGTGESTADDPS